MQEPELLQKQRQSLRLFRQATANRELAEKALAENHAIEKTQAENVQKTAQSKADKLQEKALYTYTSAQDKLVQPELSEILPFRTEVPVKPLPQRSNNDPEVELDHAVSLTTSLSAQLWTSLDSYRAWHVRQQEHKYKMIGVATLIVVAVLVGGYLLLGAAGKAWQYNSAISALEASEWEKARRLLIELGDYQDSEALFEEATYQLVLFTIQANSWDAALSLTSDSPQELLYLACPLPQEPTLGDTWKRCSDGMMMVYVPGGSFMMGNMDGERNERPNHEVTMASFWLDKTEITNKMYGQCVTAGRCNISRHADASTFNGENQPVIGVSWYDANTYCEWIGGELPTEAQWEYAARGPDENIYPWGNNPPSEELANFDDNVGQTTNVGNYPSGASWVGALDMAGNAMEWVADWYSRYYYSISPVSNPTGPHSGSDKVLRGGSWFDNEHNLRTTNRNFDYPAFQNLGVGFRCVSSSEK